MMQVASWPKFVLALTVGVQLAASAAAVEPVDEFLAALRQRQWFDQANAYLDLLEADSTTAESLRQRLPYERGVTALQAAVATRDPATRDTQLTRANELFAEFTDKFPDHSFASTAKVQRGNILIERARLAAEQAAKSNQSQELAAARKQFDEARRQFDQAIKDLEAQLAKLPKLVDPKDQETAAHKQQLSGDLAQLQLLRPTIDFELAGTFSPGSKDAKKHLEAAAASYHVLYETYRTRATGLLARFWEGRCYQRLEKIPQALACFRELIDLPKTDETRALRTKGTRRALECLTSDSQRKFQEAIERGQRWQDEEAGKSSDPDALAIRYLTAVALEGQSSSLPDRDPNRKKLAGVARDYVVPVAQHPGEFQRPAKMLLVALSDNKDAKDKPGTPTFAELFEQARQSIAQMQATDAKLAGMGSQGDEEAVAKLRQQRDAAAATARRFLQEALRSSDANVTADDLNSARYYRCFLEWDAGHLYDAAVLGEFLLRHYPDSSAGRQGARIALAAYVKMYADSTDETKQFEIQHIEQLGDAVFERWPNTEEADEAALQLLGFSTSRGDWDKAVGYLGKISPDSPRRGQAELRAGQALWSAYLRRSQLPENERPPQAELDALKQQAQDVLAEGIGRMEKSAQVDATLAAAVFAMAQICVDTGAPDEAIQWLEREKIGPLVLVEANHPVAGRAGFAIETYKLALRAYVAVTPQQVDKAEATMDALEKLVQGAGDANAAENLTKIYVSLGRELELQLQELRRSGQTKQLESVSKAFEIFLDRVTKRDSGNSYASLNWVGETYFSLGAGFDAGPGKTSEQAATYFAKAAEAYKHMLEVVQDDPKFKDNPESLTAVRLRLADCYRRAGNYDDAVSLLVEVLKQKPMLLPAQVQAAETLQARGASDPKSYGLAILGAQPGRDGRNTIWGWAKISNLTMNNEKFADTFHHARLKLVEARYQYAQTVDEASKRAAILAVAKQDLWITYNVRPELGGEVTVARYERLLKQIQGALGEKESGLQEFRDRRAAGTADATQP